MYYIHIYVCVCVKKRLLGCTLDIYSQQLSFVQPHASPVCGSNTLTLGSTPLPSLPPIAEADFFPQGFSDTYCIRIAKG